MKNEAFNVGLSDANLTKLELCALIRKQISGFVYLEAPIGEDPDKRDYLVSNAKIEAAGFRPKFSLNAGIQELIKGYTILRGTTASGGRKFGFIDADRAALDIVQRAQPFPRFPASMSQAQMVEVIPLHLHPQ